MTLAIYNGVDLLVDKITTFNYEDHLFKRMYKHSDEPAAAYFERKSKLCGLETPTKVTSYGNKILTYLTVGKQDISFYDYMENSEADLKTLVEVWRHWGSLDKDIVVLALEEDGALCNITVEDDRVSSRGFKGGGDSNIYFGQPSNTLYGLETVHGLYLTPLEAMVIAQARFPNLGRRFDHYHFPTRTYKLDLDLSDRQRQFILDKYNARAKVSNDLKPVDICNLPKE